ncbi:hypothetical protein BY996DRAFT_6442053 [Phakopsora pachyrhizi]|nr:hypothetical protein BY996DRAFT_6442053 [Phakopsora pachyrhizi]
MRLVNLVIGVGIVVEFCSHIARAFARANGGGSEGLGQEGITRLIKKQFDQVQNQTVSERVRGTRPCVIIVDKLNSVAPQRGNQGDSGGVMERIVSQVLDELDGISNCQLVACNNKFLTYETDNVSVLWL